MLWGEVMKQYAGIGRALLAYNTDNEQGFAFETHDHKWHPVDREGITLIHRPSDRAAYQTPPSRGWSKAAKRRRFGNR